MAIIYLANTALIKSAWFLAHRIREALRSGDLAPFGGEGGIVEVDETFIGRKKGSEVKRSYHHKMKVLALVDRSTGRSRAMVVENVHPATIMPLVRENIAAESYVMTDEAARAAECDEDEARWDETLRKVAKQKPGDEPKERNS